MRRRKEDREDRRPWAIIDPQCIEAERRSWHKSNAVTVARMLNEQHKEPGRFIVFDRIKERKART